MMQRVKFIGGPLDGQVKDVEAHLRRLVVADFGPTIPRWRADGPPPPIGEEATTVNRYYYIYRPADELAIRFRYERSVNLAVYEENIKWLTN